MELYQHHLEMIVPLLGKRTHSSVIKGDQDTDMNATGTCDIAIELKAFKIFQVSVDC